MAETEQVTMVTAYLTKGTADEDGNYYVPILVPSNATLQLPITDIAPDDSLGNKGLKFDWTTHKWQVSDQDPTTLLIANLQAKLKADDDDNLALKTQLAELLKQQAIQQLGGAK